MEGVWTSDVLAGGKEKESGKSIVQQAGHVPRRMEKTRFGIQDI